MMSFLSQAGLILLSAFLLAFSHPWSPPIISRSQNLIADHGLQALLAWIGLLPFLLLAKRLKGGRLFAAALGLSFAYFFLSLFWINNAIVIYGNLNLLVSFAMTGGLSLLMGSMWAFGLFWGILAHRHTGLRLSITLPICVVAWEFIRNYFFTGFPWQNLAYSQHYNAPVLQTASLWGIYGINFMLILSNAVLYELIQWRRTKQKEDFPRYSVALLVGLVGFSYAYGVVMMHVNDRREAAAPRLKAALIQGNIDQDTKNDSYRFAYRILDVYQGLTLQVPDDVDLVIWPEAAYPFNVPHGSTHMSRVFSRPNSTWPSRLPWHMLIGIPTYERLPNLKKYFNSAFLLDPDMKVLGSFDKSHLVPFGEYVPFHKFIDVNKIVPGAGMFYPGTLGQGLSFGDYRFGALICYEGIFPEISREYANIGVQFLVNITNDAWYGPSSAPYQHLAFYSFRAVETGKALLRAANTGFSAWIDSSGRIRKRTDLFSRTILIDSIPLMNHRTLYRIIGDSFVWPMIAMWLYWTLGILRSSRRSQRRKST